MIKKTHLYKEAMRYATKIAQEPRTRTKVGSSKYFLFGPQLSEQSLAIKTGKLYEAAFLSEVKNNSALTMMEEVGIQDIGNENKDFDMVFKNEAEKTIYYREMKANINLDTEKTKATATKVKTLAQYLENKYPDYKVDAGVFCPTIYEWSDIRQHSAIKSKVKQFNNLGVKVDFAFEIFQILSLHISNEEWLDMGLEIGKVLKS